jgi:hypothetical protein
MQQTTTFMYISTVSSCGITDIHFYGPPLLPSFPPPPAGGGIAKDEPGGAAVEPLSL